ncbi:MAG: hypothetical protein J6Y89_09815, partial [Lachnospiraceae bacterium]|nr:hypothetical protein [Lachnospiraceae bacterium]
NLFKMLSDKDNMKIITYLYTLSGSACVTAGTISKALCINRDKVDKLLKSLVDYSIFNTSGNLPFHKIAIVNENGEEDAYEVDPNLGGIFLALMFLAKDYINPPCGYQMQVNSRSKSWADRGKLFGKS